MQRRPTSVARRATVSGGTIPAGFGRGRAEDRFREGGARTRGGAGQHHPTPTRAYRPRHDLDLLAGDQPERDRQRRALPPSADDARERRARPPSGPAEVLDGAPHASRSYDADRWLLSGRLPRKQPPRRVAAAAAKGWSRLPSRDGRFSGSCLLPSVVPASGLANLDYLGSAYSRARTVRAEARPRARERLAGVMRASIAEARTSWFFTMSATLASRSGRCFPPWQANGARERRVNSEVPLACWT